jgi:hypothetical protein
MKQSDITLLLALIEIAAKAQAAIADIKANKPEAYAHVSEHHASALASLEAAKPAE